MDKVLIVGMNLVTNQKRQNFELAMNEMVSLVEACNMEPVGRVEQNMESANAATYIGAGKVQEVREMVKALEAHMVVFDNGLSPIQLRNLSRELGCAVMDCRLRWQGYNTCCQDWLGFMTLCRGKVAPAVR